MKNNCIIFFKRLNDSNVNYCHWKSNNNINLDPNKTDDYDLLVDIKDKNKFEKKLKNLFFYKKNINSYLVHYIIFEKDYIMHLHVYYKLITSGLLYKNYHFPNSLILNKKNKNLYRGIINTPLVCDDYIFLITRKICEFQSILELILSIRNKELDKEIKFFENKKLLDQKFKLKLKKKNLIDYNDFLNFQTFYKNRDLFKLYFLCLKYYTKLSKYRKTNYFLSELLRLFKLINLIFKKIFRLNNSLIKNHSGLMIAILGPDNSGKSTLINGLSSYYKKYFDVKCFHLGSPKNNFLQRIINIFSLFFSKKSHLRNSNIVLSQDRNLDFGSSFLISLKSIVQAISKYYEFKIIKKRYEEGKIIFIDRYVKDTPSFFDGPKIELIFCRSKIIQFFSIIEKKIYKKIDYCDLAFYLQVNNKTLFLRNNKRKKIIKENSTYLSKSIIDAKDFKNYKSLKFVKLNSGKLTTDNLIIKIHRFLITNNYIKKVL